MGDLVGKASVVKGRIRHKEGSHMLQGGPSLAKKRTKLRSKQQVTTQGGCALDHIRVGHKVDCMDENETIGWSHGQRGPSDRGQGMTME